MRFGWRGHDGPDERAPDPRACVHLWRVRDVSCDLPGAECSVCDRCGALRFEGADQLADRLGDHPWHVDAQWVPADSPDQDGSYLGGLAQRWSAPRHESPSPPEE
jgi:hypothetical protein